ncbi:MAG: hypothetical protein IJP38_06595 [Oscillospiraceae bacterium]|nr:hypothetical protein [Oscillospiraceae bacterium]
MCQRSGSIYVICAIALAAGILFGVAFPSGLLVFVLCILLIAIGVLMLL